MTAAADVIRAGDIEKLKSMVAADPKVSSEKDPAGVSLILTALYNKRADMADVLAKPRTDLDVFESAALGKIDRLTALLDEDPGRGAAYSPDGWTALHLGCFFGRAGVTKLLLDRGADPMVASKNLAKLQPMHSAAAAGHKTCGQLLVNAGADVNAKQQGGFTALHARAQVGDAEFVLLLLNNGADPNLKNDAGKNAIDLASAKGQEQVVALLKERAAMLE